MPALSEALALCRLHGATLVIAKLDRLSRDAAFLLNLQKAGVRFVAVDMPEANELVVGIIGVDPVSWSPSDFPHEVRSMPHTPIRYEQEMLAAP